MDMVLFDFIIIVLVVFPFSREDNYNSKHFVVVEVTLAGYKNLRIMEIISICILVSQPKQCNLDVWIL